MRQNDDIFDPSQLNYEAWRDLLRSKCGRYYSVGIEPAAFYWLGASCERPRVHRNG
jgi:AraC family transcriptional regulator, positive regulator of tynA and feaB